MNEIEFARTVSDTIELARELDVSLYAATRGAAIAILHLETEA